MNAKAAIEPGAAHAAPAQVITDIPVGDAPISIRRTASSALARAFAGIAMAEGKGNQPMATRKATSDTSHRLSHSYARRATQIRAAIDPQRGWIETNLGVPLSEAAVLYVADLVQSVEVPHGHVPLFELTRHRVSGRWDGSLVYGAEDAWAYEIEWTDGPVLVRLRDLPTPVIALYAAYHGGPDSAAESREDILIAPKHGLEPLILLLKSLHVSDGKARLKVGHNPARAITQCAWDSLTLDRSIVSLLREDFDMFFERERWFREMGLPFRRGYLLHGPPGCGKSTAIRAMISSRGLTAYAMRFFARGVDDSDLDNLFTSAAQNARSIVILEDIDRVFPRKGQSRTEVSLQALLNALDGWEAAKGSSPSPQRTNPQRLTRQF